MSLEFDETYFAGGIGYGKYQDYSHFQARANWVKAYYDAQEFDGLIYELGCAHGYTLHRMHTLGLPIKGIESSEHAHNEVDEACVDACYHVNAKDHTFPETDLIVSWNFLDCLASEAEAEAVITKLNAATSRQIHVLCVTDDDDGAQNFIDQGYFIKAMSYWKNLFADGTILVNYKTGAVWEKDTNWTQVYDWEIPTCWGRVSD